MNTLKTLTAAIVASLTMLGNASADQLMDTIHPESADLFDHSSGLDASGQNDIVSLNDNAGKEVWSYEYEQYVNPDDYRADTFADINKYMEANPTAAGGRSEEVFKLNEMDGDYHLN